MRKLLVALMMVAFAATAFAGEIKFSGTYDVNGRTVKNYNMNSSREYVNGVLTADDSGNQSVTSSYYSHSLDVWMEANTDKDTFFKGMIEFVDSAWDNSRANGAGNAEDGDYPNNFELQRAWIGHNFGAVTLEAGLMNAGSWGYTFGDNAEGQYRIKATLNNVAGGKLTIFTQKNAEETSFGNDIVDAEKDDADVYSLGYKGTFGGIMVAPKLDYTINSRPSELGGFNANDSKTIDFDIAAGGKFGALTVEAEYQMRKVSYNSETVAANANATSRKDYTTYGFYGNAGYKMGAATVGFLTAYASVSDDDAAPRAYSYGDDFDVLFVLDDALGADLSGGADSLAGFWTNAIYATYDVNDKLGVVAKLAYAKSNFDKASNAENAGDHNLKDATAWELDLAGNYAITKNLTYYVNFGYAKVSLDEKTGETAAQFDARDIDDAIILVKHGLTLSF